MDLQLWTIGDVSEWNFHRFQFSRLHIGYCEPISFSYIKNGRFQTSLLEKQIFQYFSYSSKDGFFDIKDLKPTIFGIGVWHRGFIYCMPKMVGFRVFRENQYFEK